MSSYKNKTGLSRRKLLGITAVGAIPLAWHTPVVKSVILPAHAETTETVESCSAPRQVGGQLEGNPYGMESCQEACQAYADENQLELCDVSETISQGKTECTCDVDEIVE